MMRKLFMMMMAWTMLTGMAQAQTNDDEEQPLLTLACISDIHAERSLIDCANLSDIKLRGSFIRTLNLLKKQEKIDVMKLQAKENQSTASSSRSQDGGTEQILPQSLQKESTLTTSGFQTSGLLNCERITLCCFRLLSLCHLLF